MNLLANNRIVPFLLTLTLACLTACPNVGGQDAGPDLTALPDLTVLPDLTPPDLTPPPPAKLSTDVQPIFNSFCSCHQTSTPAASLNLSSGNAYASLVGVASSNCSIASNPNQTRVVAGNAAQSYLIDKLTLSTPPCGLQMPRLAPPLSTAQIDTIRSWINDGAQDN